MRACIKPAGPSLNILDCARAITRVFPNLRKGRSMRFSLAAWTRTCAFGHSPQRKKIRESRVTPPKIQGGPGFSKPLIGWEMNRVAETSMKGVIRNYAEKDRKGSFASGQEGGWDRFNSSCFRLPLCYIESKGTFIFLLNHPA